MPLDLTASQSSGAGFLGTAVMGCRSRGLGGFGSYMLMLSLTSTDPFIPRWTATSALVLWTVRAAMAELVHRITSRDHWPFERGLGIWIGAFLLAMGTCDTLAT
ncbi:hypothetical protein [Nonomuraea sp. NPDC001831]|uniref:hypothetical protein n=1 Tax=Nonomuraea sp. NPDC001831 TaxID=3364340 RepID=UPI0036896A23